MEPNLGTTNLLLGIMAAVSLLEGLVIIGIGVAGFVMYKRVSELVSTLEAKHVAPAMVRVNAILDDVKGVTNTVRAETERVDHAIHSTMDRIDDTADRLRSNVRAKTSRVIGVIRGARAVIEALLRSASRHQPSAT
jgi:pyrimidine operon attenuation protein/uracil phosphoribosyltransferase